MPTFVIGQSPTLGMSHSGEVSSNATGAVKLTDEEVKTLVALIREKGTADVEELELEENYPDIYDELRSACYNLAYEAVEEDMLWDGYASGYFNYDIYELMEYCESECGFVFEYDEKDYLLDDGSYDDDEDAEEDESSENEEGGEDDDEEPELDEDRLFEDKQEAFEKWLDDYLRSLSSSEAIRFFYNHMGADLDMDDMDIDFDVEIPEAIIMMAKEQI